MIWLGVPPLTKSHLKGGAFRVDHNNTFMVPSSLCRLIVEPDANIARAVEWLAQVFSWMRFQTVAEIRR